MDRSDAFRLFSIRSVSLRVMVAAAVIVASDRAAQSQCEPSPEVRKVMQASSARVGFGLSRETARAERQKILAEGIRQNPDDFFLLHAEFAELGEEAKSQKLQELKTLAEHHLDQPLDRLLWATALMGRDTPTAIRMLEDLATTHPELSQASLYLARISASGRFTDKARAGRAVTAFLAQCPGPLDGHALQTVVQLGSKQQAAQTAEAVRRRLAASSDITLGPVWKGLWSLEFKALPFAEQGTVRRQIVADLARLQSASGELDLDGLIFVRDGSRSAEDKTGVERAEAEILRRFPASNTAQMAVTDAWRRQHPIGQSFGLAKRPESVLRAELAATEDWHRRWPEDPHILYQRFEALAGLPDTKPEELVSVGDEFMAAYERDHYFWISPRLVEFQVAEAWVKRGVRLDRVPELVEAAYRAYRDQQESLARDDRTTDATRKDVREELDEVAVERVRVLLDAAIVGNQPAKVVALDAELAKLEPGKLALKGEIQALRGRIAEHQGRTLDALLLMRTAQDNGVEISRAAARDVLIDKDIERLWKQLGGTGETLALFKRTSATATEAMTWEHPENPLPSFALSDLEGRQWRLADLVGKAVFINVWATWCGPCRLEHPDVQKLYEKLKTRSDVVVLSFNVDADPGPIGPYLRENKYTFPVLPAEDVVKAVVPTLSIPRTWIIDPKGKLVWEQVGYGPNPKWQDMMVAKLDEVLKQK